ncbi:Siderophore iron transporter mirC [Yarrowia sp. C11]|nr:Siderophore iron transporter mirC [Yarrowia sp. C11]KAG5359426.1 Siderophore iron transporter mirC [Yarrowia sp. E02]
MPKIDNKWLPVIKHALIAPQRSTETKEQDFSSDSDTSESPKRTTWFQKIFNPPLHQQDDTCAAEEGAPAGSQEMEQITSLWNKKDLWLAWGSMLLLGISLGLEVQTVGVYSTFATSDFNQMSLLSALSVVKAVMYIATRPILAKFADVLGRFETLLLSVLVFTIGFIMLAASPNIGTYFAAHIFYVFGQVGIQFMEQVFAADTSDLKNRAFFVVLPNICYLFVPWCAAPITNAVLTHSTWHWGYGMWCIIIPVLSIPVLTIMFRHKMRARALGLESGKAVRNFRSTISQFDILGLVLFTGGLSLLFLAVTLVKTSKSWGQPHVLSMIIIGPILLILFPIWEKLYPKYPFLSFSALKDRTLITGCAVVALYSLAYYIYSPYYYAWLLVCKGLSVTAATNVNSVWVVGSTAGSLIAAPVIKYSNRLKPIIVVGGCLYMLGLGLTYRYRQPYHSLAQFIVAQAIEGLGTGMIQFPVLVMIQSVVSHRQVVSATAIFYSSISVGTAVGDAISGSLYRQQYPKKLAEFASFLSEADIDKMVNNVQAPLKYTWGSPERDAIVGAFNNVYRHMLYGPVVVGGVLILLTLTLPNVDLGELNQHVKGTVFGSGARKNVRDEDQDAGHSCRRDSQNGSLKNFKHGGLCETQEKV